MSYDVYLDMQTKGEIVVIPKICVDPCGIYLCIFDVEDDIHDCVFGRVLTTWEPRAREANTGVLYDAVGYCVGIWFAEWSMACAVEMDDQRERGKA